MKNVNLVEVYLVKETSQEHDLSDFCAVFSIMTALSSGTNHTQVCLIIFLSCSMEVELRFCSLIVRVTTRRKVPEDTSGPLEVAIDYTRVDEF